MTNMPVLDKGSAAQNLLSARGTTKKAASVKGEFDAVLQQTTETGKQGAEAEARAESGKAPEAKGTAEAKEAAGTKDAPQKEGTNPVQDKVQDAEAKVEEPGQAEAEETVELPEDLSEKTEVLERAGGEMMAQLAAQMGIPRETVEAAMEDLKMTEVSLLKPKNVKTLMVHLTEGADDMSILTDESFYQAVTEALDTLHQITEGVQEATGMNPQELGAAVQEAERQLATPVVTEAEVMPQEAPVKAQVAQEAAASVSIPQGKAKPDVSIAQESAPKAELAEEEPVELAETSEKAQGEKPKDTFAEMPKETAKEMPKGVARHESARKDGQNPFVGSGGQTGNLGFRAAVAAAAQTAETESAFPMAQTMEIMDQIMDYMKVSVKPEVTSLEMQLHPESLGTLHIQISNKEGAVTAQFIAQNESVKAALESQVVQLRENLEQQGVKVEAVEVTVAQYSLERNPGGDQGAAGQGGKQRKGIRNLNLSELDLEEESDLTEEEQLTAQVMQASGSTVNFKA